MCATEIGRSTKALRKHYEDRAKEDFPVMRRSMHAWFRSWAVLTHAGDSVKMYIPKHPSSGPIPRSNVGNRDIIHARIFQHQTLIESKLRITSRPPINADVMVATATSK